MMLTLIKGQSNKSTYMSILHNGMIGGVMISVGHKIYPMLFEDRELWHVDPKDVEYSLMEYLDIILKNVSYDYDKVFLYVNFNLEQSNIFKEMVIEKQYPLDIYITVQDNQVPQGQIVIEEVEVFRF